MNSKALHPGGCLFLRLCWSLLRRLSASLSMCSRHVLQGPAVLCS